MRLLFDVRENGGSILNTNQINRTDSIAVFWDVENCAPPRRTKGPDIIENIRLALKDFGVIRQINAYAEL